MAGGAQAARLAPQPRAAARSSTRAPTSSSPATSTRRRSASGTSSRSSATRRARPSSRSRPGSGGRGRGGWARRAGSTSTRRTPTRSSSARSSGRDGDWTLSAERRFLALGAQALEQAHPRRRCTRRPRGRPVSWSSSSRPRKCAGLSVGPSPERAWRGGRHVAASAASAARPRTVASRSGPGRCRPASAARDIARRRSPARGSGGPPFPRAAASGRSAGRSRRARPRRRSSRGPTTRRPCALRWLSTIAVPAGFPTRPIAIVSQAGIGSGPGSASAPARR